jgi:hypothetical protein
MGLHTPRDPAASRGAYLYGCANGDPINFSDPFGLSTLGLAAPAAAGAAALTLADITLSSSTAMCSAPGVSKRRGP